MTFTHLIRSYVVVLGVMLTTINVVIPKAQAELPHYTLQHMDQEKAGHAYGSTMPPVAPYGSKKMKAPAYDPATTYASSDEAMTMPDSEVPGANFSNKVNAYKDQYANEHPDMFQTVAEESAEAAAAPSSGRFGGSMPSKPLRMVNTETTSSTPVRKRRPSSLYSSVKEMKPYNVGGGSVYFD